MTVAPMKLHWSPRSPFVRKVMIMAHEIGIADKITLVRSVAAMAQANDGLMRDNPLSKIPTIVLADGRVLFDSPVICEYFDSLHGGPKFFPTELNERLVALKRQALGDGLLDFLLLWRNELSRPKERQSPPHLEAYLRKRNATLAYLEKEIPALEATPFNIGHITIGCGFLYFDFRFPEDKWREEFPKVTAWANKFAKRPSVLATEPVDDSDAPMAPPSR